MNRLLKWTGWFLIAVLGLAGVLILAYQVPDQPVNALKIKWAPPPSQFIPIAGMQIHLRDEGEGIPIVLLHGTSASLHTWDGWAEALKADHRVIRYDMPGFGLTGPSPDNDYTIETYARVLIAVLDRLGVDQCVLAGNSLGGRVAWSAALLYGDRISRLVLIDASGYPFRPESVPIGFQIARIPLLNRLLGNVLPRGMVESSLKNVYGDPDLVTPDLVDRYFELTTRAGNREALVHRFQQLQPGPLTLRIPELALPTLIIWGGKDRLIPPDMGRRFHREIPGSVLKIFDDLGHVPQEEAPEETVSVFKDFMARQIQRE